MVMKCVFTHLHFRNSETFLFLYQIFCITLIIVHLKFITKFIILYKLFFNRYDKHHYSRPVYLFIYFYNVLKYFMVKSICERSIQIPKRKTTLIIRPTISSWN